MYPDYFSAVHNAPKSDTVVAQQMKNGGHWHFELWVNRLVNRARRQSEFPMFISCQRQDTNMLPKQRQSHQGDKLCDVSTVPLVARWPVFLARGSDADGEPHWLPGSQINMVHVLEHS